MHSRNIDVKGDCGEVLNGNENAEGQGHPAEPSCQPVGLDGET